MAVVAPLLPVVVAALPVQPSTVSVGSKRNGEKYDYEQPSHRPSVTHDVTAGQKKTPRV